MAIMTSFSNNWVKEKNIMNTSDKIREAVKTPQPLKPRIEFAKNRIQSQNQKLDTILDKLNGKEKSLFNQVVNHLQKHDVQESKVLSNELAQVRKSSKLISQLKTSLEQVHLRLDSTVDVGNVMAALGPAMGSLTNLRSGLSGVVPEVDTQLGEINGVFTDIMTSAAGIGNTSIAYDASSEDVDKILSEAGAVAEQRVNENFPDVPIGSYGRGSSSRSSIGEHSQ
ncbi:MAG: Snf7 family protein [Nitrososphaeraceae archaeon]|jgi:division protein CdvB (Snf7/Vps24/ESCRT-III family)